MITKIKIKFYLIDLLIKSKFNNNKILTTFQVLSFKNLTHNILMKMMIKMQANNIVQAPVWGPRLQAIIKIQVLSFKILPRNISMKMMIKMQANNIIKNYTLKLQIK